MTSLKVNTIQYNNGKKDEHYIERPQVSFNGIANDLITLSTSVSNLVKELVESNASKAKKVQIANERIAIWLQAFAFVNNTFDNLEETIRELARREWKTRTS